MSSTETMAFLHAHGLDVDPKELAAAVRAAIEAARERYYGGADEEGLTADEARGARSGGLEDGPFTASSDPLLGGVDAFAAVVRMGLTTRQAAARLGVSDARIRQRLRERTLLAVRVGRIWRLPAYQFTDRSELPGWSEVCRELPASASPVALERWLTLPHADLVAGEDETPMSPLTWLVEGRPPGVVAALAGGLA